MSTPAQAKPVRTLAPRNATEDGILAAAREMLAEASYDELTVDAIARRCYVSRTAVYFYFPNKRAVIDRLIQQVFTDMLTAARPYLEHFRRVRDDVLLGVAERKGERAPLVFCLRRASRVSTPLAAGA